MKKVLVLGCGLIGRTVALDLSADFEVTVMDPAVASLARLEDRKNITKVQKSACDLDILEEYAAKADIVCGLLPGHLEGEVQKKVISMGKNYVSPVGYLHMEGLDELAKKTGSVCVFDMGIAPGMSNYLVARAAALLDELDVGCIYVGGVPEKLDPPFNYRTVFCLEDTMEMYCMPARYMENNKTVSAPALSGLEEIDIPGVGKFEAFLTDGLRSASENIKGKFVAEKTMRWPGFVDALNILKAAGCFNKEAVIVDGKEVIPFKTTTELLRPLWKLRPEMGERDMTVMHIVAKGPKADKYITYTWDLIDKYDEKNMFHSMARTTGYPCALTVRAVANGIISKPGFNAPEALADNEDFFKYLMPELAKRGIVFKKTTIINE
ncbi:saccharopine dehydrogenase family protein [Cloacibacillus evryensis]|uniref:Saccharopine dehydrogenase NADP-binding domain-containing protein n=1 Tax=Cloacibacillus evryensis TaxID=508460 RepID=A0AAW5K391_9BACT|nr:saccharopine dehydrogenase C-terminal domain-containing protein [Cloacibacillus evryensis]MCQ4814201.1 saccharopine dehydrogenase NADP-binding domain-containing protein [Cloacibacillus evryensis]